MVASNIGNYYGKDWWVPAVGGGIAGVGGVLMAIGWIGELAGGIPFDTASALVTAGFIMAGIGAVIAGGYTIAKIALVEGGCVDAPGRAA